MGVSPGWYTEPKTGVGYRYWDGTAWTAAVASPEAEANVSVDATGGALRPCGACGHPVWTSERTCGWCHSAQPPLESVSRGTDSILTTPIELDTERFRAPDWRLWAARFGRLLSLRVLLGGLVASIFVSVVLSFLWDPLQYLWWFLYPAFLVGVFFNDDLVLRCPWCEKRVKLGATTCHHCGRDVLPD